MERKTVDEFLEKLFCRGLWKSKSFSQFGCLQKSVAALSKNPLFHIKFSYYGNNYYFIIYLYIFIKLYFFRNEVYEYALYL